MSSIYNTNCNDSDKDKSTLELTKADETPENTIDLRGDLTRTNDSSMERL